MLITTLRRTTRLRTTKIIKQKGAKLFDLGSFELFVYLIWLAFCFLRIDFHAFFFFYNTHSFVRQFRMNLQQYPWMYEKNKPIKG